MLSGDRSIDRLQLAIGPGGLLWRPPSPPCPEQLSAHSSWFCEIFTARAAHSRRAPAESARSSDGSSGGIVSIWAGCLGGEPAIRHRKPAIALTSSASTADAPRPRAVSVAVRPGVARPRGTYPADRNRPGCLHPSLSLSLSLSIIHLFIPFLSVIAKRMQIQNSTSIKWMKYCRQK